ncbi:MAG: hypothetical protein AB8H80_17760 [Planctomycetota bacterium]
MSASNQQRIAPWLAGLLTGLFAAKATFVIGLFVQDANTWTFAPVLRWAIGIGTIVGLLTGEALARAQANQPTE